MHNGMERRQRKHDDLARRYLFTGLPGADDPVPAATVSVVSTAQSAAPTVIHTTEPTTVPVKTTPAQAPIVTTVSSPAVAKTTSIPFSSAVESVRPPLTASAIASSPVTTTTSSLPAVLPITTATSSVSVIPPTSSLVPTTARLVTSVRASPSPVVIVNDLTSSSTLPSISSSPFALTIDPQTSTILAIASPVSQTSSSSASSSAAAKAISAATSSSSLSTGSIAGLASALAVFLAVLVAFFFIRRKSRRTRRKNAQDAIGKYLPSSPDYGEDRYSPRELGDDDVMGGVGGPQMAERQPVGRQGVGREHGGPRPPTMIESGRAGIGRTMVLDDSPISPAPPMPSFYPAITSNSPGHSAYHTSAPFAQHNANADGFAFTQSQQSFPSPIGRSLVSPHPFNQQQHQQHQQHFDVPAAPVPAHFLHQQPQHEADFPISSQPSPFALPPLHSGSGADFDPRFSSIPSTFGHQQQASFPAQTSVGKTDGHVGAGGGVDLPVYQQANSNEDAYGGF